MAEKTDLVELNGAATRRWPAHRSALGAGLSVLVAAVAVALVFLRGGPPVNTGPLGGSRQGSLCVPAGRVTMGADGFTNRASHDTTIDSLSLAGAHHVRLLGVWLVPVVHRHGYTLVGVVDGFPPAGRHIPSDVRWQQRRKLPTTIPPARRGHYWDLVFGLQRQGAATGTVRSYQLDYTSNGRRYIWQSGIMDILRARGCPG